MADEQADGTQPVRRTGRERWVKLAFVAVAVGGALVIWQMQKSDPDVPWSRDLPGALERARQENAWVVVLVTQEPMGHYDRRFAEEVVQREFTWETLEQQNYLPVHLRAETDAETVARYELSTAQTPTIALLRPDGTVVKQQSGFLDIHSFRNLLRTTRQEAGEPHVPADVARD